MTSYWILGFRHDDDENVLLPLTEPIDGADGALLAASQLLRDESELDEVVVFAAGIEDPPTSLRIRREDDSFVFQVHDDDIEMRRAVAKMDLEITHRDN